MDEHDSTQIRVRNLVHEDEFSFLLCIIIRKLWMTSLEKGYDHSNDVFGENTNVFRGFLLYVF